MTNFERWRVYTQHIGSPDSFLNFGYYSLIASCLQRRVWVGPAHMPIYPNEYIVLCGPPATGKGQVIRPVKGLLSHWKRHTAAEQERLNKEKEILQNRAKKISSSMFQEVNGSTKKLNDEPLLFTIAGEAYGSYQALVNALADSYDCIHYKDKEGNSKTYLHSSMSLVLEELASIFRKHSDDIANFLLETYDCGDYKYIVMSRDVDRIKSCCLNILAGTTPAFMQDTIDDKLTNEGFGSRTLFICANEPRFEEMFIPELTPAQQLAKVEILQHIRKLKDIYGGCAFTKEAEDYLIHWRKSSLANPRPNSSPKLDAYYGRKKLHLQKLATAIHFSDHLHKEIGIGSVKLAHYMLDSAEKDMHLALTFRGNNPLTILSRAMERYLGAKGKATRQMILMDLWEYGNQIEQNQVIEALTVMGKIKSEEVGENKILHWRLA